MHSPTPEEEATASSRIRVQDGVSSGGFQLSPMDIDLTGRTPCGLEWPPPARKAVGSRLSVKPPRRGAIFLRGCRVRVLGFPLTGPAQPQSQPGSVQRTSASSSVLSVQRGCAEACLEQQGSHWYSLETWYSQKGHLATLTPAVHGLPSCAPQAWQAWTRTSMFGFGHSRAKSFNAHAWTDVKG